VYLQLNYRSPSVPFGDVWRLAHEISAAVLRHLLKPCFASQLDEPVERNQLSLIKRDKVNFVTFWLKDDSLEDSNLLPPNEIAAEIVENIDAAFDCFGKVAASLQGSGDGPSRR
jgi:hypothetical protein